MFIIEIKNKDALILQHILMKNSLLLHKVTIKKILLQQMLYLRHLSKNQKSNYQWILN